MTEPAAGRDCATLLTLLAFCFGLTGMPAVPVGLFVGPHIFFPALSMLAACVLCAWLAGRVGRGGRAVTWAARAVGAGLCVLGAAGVASAVRAGEWPVAGVSAYLLTVGATLVWKSRELPVGRS